MARPRKTGIDYFSIDVNMLSDRKTRRIIHSCGAESIAVIIQILCLAYAETGYYLSFDDDLTFDLSYALNLDEKKIKEVILECVKAGFFDKTMFENHNILTSKRMQKNYKQATEKRVNNKLNPDYNLVSAEKTLVSGEETPVYEAETLFSGVKSTQSIEQHSIVKNSIEEAANIVKVTNRAREEITQDEINRLERTFGKVSDKALLEYKKLKKQYGAKAVVDALITTRLRGGKMISYTTTILKEDYTEVLS